jgi:O-6-methylguanine DNA methyltransferase
MRKATKISDFCYNSKTQVKQFFVHKIKNSNSHRALLKKSLIETKIGTMLAVSDDYFLYGLEFLDSKTLKRKTDHLQKCFKSDLVFGHSDPIFSIKAELKDYFNGKLTGFKTSFMLIGTDFQKTVWKELITIPFGGTRSYLEHAHLIQNPKSYRAVANANGANKLAIMIPCHRVISHNGDLGGYASGLWRKKWLLDFEKNC